MYFKFSTLGLRLKLLILESGGITLDYETIEGEAQGLQTASKLSGIQSDHHQPQIRKMKHRLQILKQQIDQLKCDNKSSTSEHNDITRRSTFV